MFKQLSIGVLLYCCYCISCHAHFLNRTRCEVTIDETQACAHIELTIDFTRVLQDPEYYFQLSQLPFEQTAEARGELIQRLKQGLILNGGDKALDYTVEQFIFPQLPLEKFIEPYAAPMSTLLLRADLPAHATAITLTSDPFAGIEYPLITTFRSQAIPEHSVTRWLYAGEVSPVFQFNLAFDNTSETTVPPLPQAPALTDTLLHYLQLGFTHILPHGLDHMLFILGLFLLNIHWRPLLCQISVFTLAHTVTLGLSSMGTIPQYPAVVEPLIAFSIAYVGIENIFKTQLKQSRLILIFIFGLIHGMGFAGVLYELGLPGESVIFHLLAFNVGVELGQLALIILAYLVLGPFRHWHYYKQAILIPLSSSISIVALVWTTQRIFYS